MPHDPARVGESREWFAKADEDLAAGRLLLAADSPLPSLAAFHAQQAAEKAMKGYLAWHDRPFRKTHSLVEIGEACAAIDGGLESLLRRTAVLTEYAWKFRYPGEPTMPSADEAAEAIALAGEVYDSILARLPDEVRP